MEKKPVASAPSSAAAAPVSSVSPSWRALQQKEAKAAKAAKAAKETKAATSAKAAKAKAEKDAKEVKQGQARKQREDSLTNKHNAAAFRKAAAQERAEKVASSLAKFKPELVEVLAQAKELTRALSQVPTGARNIRLYPAPGFVLSWSAASAPSAPSASSASKPSKPSAPSAPSKKALARKAQADARARLGLGKAKAVPRVRTDAAAATALSAATALAATAASSAASALKTEKSPAKRQELHRVYAKASAWAQGLDVQATVAEFIGAVDGITPSELCVVPFAAKAKTAQRRRLLWVGRQIGRGLAVKRAEAREAFAKAVAKAEAEIAAAAVPETDEYAELYLLNQERAKQGLAPLAPLAPELTVGEAEDMDQRSSMSFEDLVAAFEADLKEESYARDLGRFCGPNFLEAEVNAAVAAYGEGRYSWNEALEAVLAKCFAPIQQGEEGGSNE